MQFTFVELWQAMGPLAKGVVVLLVSMSLFSVSSAVERWLFLRRVCKEATYFLHAWRAQVTARGYSEAVALTKDYPQCLLAQVVQVGTQIFDTVSNTTHRSEVYDRAVRREIAAAGVTTRRGLSVLATVGSTAPFVGLFGTVIGIVNAFQRMAASGQGGLGVVSAGIAEALVTTALGIGVAIPAVWLFNFLTQRSARLLTEMECVAEELAVAALSNPQRDAAGFPNATREEGRHGNTAWPQ